MTVLSRSKIVLILLSLAIFSSASIADSVSQESAKLSNLKQTLQKQQQNYSDIQSEINDYPEKLKEVKVDLENAEAELAKARLELQNLKIEASKPGSDLDRDIKLKEHSVKMAERRANRESRSLERVIRDENSLKEEESKIKSTVDRLTRQVANQELQVAEAKSIARSQEQAIKTPKPTINIPAPEIKKAQQPQIVKEVEPAPIEKAPEIIAETVEPTPTPEKQVVLSESDYESYIVAERVMKELEEKAVIGGDYKDIVLKGSDVADTNLSHVGDKSFKGEAVVIAGDQRIRIKNNRFRILVPAEDDGETYIFVVDKKRPNNTNLYYFKKSLVALIGKNPIKGEEKAVAQKPETAIQSVAAQKESTNAPLTKDNLTKEDSEGIEIAKEQLALLEELKSDDSYDKPSFSKLVLSGSNIESDIDMEYLYHDQYTAETIVESGRQVIKINSKRFRISIPENDDGQTYRFYVDASSPQRLKVTYFKKELLKLLN